MFLARSAALSAVLFACRIVAANQILSFVLFLSVIVSFGLFRKVQQGQTLGGKRACNFLGFCTAPLVLYLVLVVHRAGMCEKREKPSRFLHPPQARCAPTCPADPTGRKTTKTTKREQPTTEGKGNESGTPGLGQWVTPVADCSAPGLPHWPWHFAPSDRFGVRVRREACHSPRGSARVAARRQETNERGGKKQMRSLGGRAWRNFNRPMGV